ncbi:MAG: DUF2141 domain-containing protein [Caulobacteraceae bacterium]|nr:DUF2141 domain-containing protein [Caulobacteraceae bacterium]
MATSKRARARIRLLATAILVAAPLAGAAVAAHAGAVDVAVTGVPDDRGHVRVELCTRSTFLTEDCPYQGAAPARMGATLVRINNVAPGEYAAQAFHDVTDGGVVHQNLLGIPNERIGFSNDAPIHLRGPRFMEAAFVVGREARSITLRVRRLFHAD